MGEASEGWRVLKFVRGCEAFGGVCASKSECKRAFKEDQVLINGVTAHEARVSFIHFLLHSSVRLY